MAGTHEVEGGMKELLEFLDHVNVSPSENAILVHLAMAGKSKKEVAAHYHSFKLVPLGQEVEVKRIGQFQKLRYGDLRALAPDEYKKVQRIIFLVTSHVLSYFSGREFEI